MKWGVVIRRGLFSASPQLRAYQQPPFPEDDSCWRAMAGMVKLQSRVVPLATAHYRVLPVRPTFRYSPHSFGSRWEIGLVNALPYISFGPEMRWREAYLDVSIGFVMFLFGTNWTFPTPIVNPSLGGNLSGNPRVEREAGMSSFVGPGSLSPHVKLGIGF